MESMVVVQSNIDLDRMIVAHVLVVDLFLLANQMLAVFLMDTMQMLLL
jgi:hypothetical protein